MTTVPHTVRCQFDASLAELHCFPGKGSFTLPKCGLCSMNLEVIIVTFHTLHHRATPQLPVLCKYVELKADLLPDKIKS